jgi:formylglycine-generating enzyme required for sulfatase activity
MDAFRIRNYVVAQTAWTKAAEQGDHLAAVWLGQLYGGGDLGQKDPFQAYKWYDIAAYLHGLEIDRLPPGSREDNQLEINWRDSTARQLTPEQVSDAQKQSRDWIAQRKRSSR